MFIKRHQSSTLTEGIFVCWRSKKDKSKGVVKADTSDPEPEGLTLLVPDIQRTAEIVYTATTSLQQANQGMYTPQDVWLKTCALPPDIGKYLTLAVLKAL